MQMLGGVYMKCLMNIDFQALVIVHKRKVIVFFLKQNICCRYSKEPSQGDASFEHLKHMLKIMDKKTLTIFC